jgi:hypothetical protein
MGAPPPPILSLSLLCIFGALIKKENKIFLIYMEIQKGAVAKSSHIWLTASSYLTKYLRIFSYIRKPFLIYDIATAPIWISLHMMTILFYFLSVWALIRPKLIYTTTSLIVRVPDGVLYEVWLSNRNSLMQRCCMWSLIMKNDHESDQNDPIIMLIKK